MNDTKGYLDRTGVLLLCVLTRLEAINNGADFNNMFDAEFLKKLDIWRADEFAVICKDFADSID